MKIIKLTQGKYAIVDDEDFEYLNQWKWSCAKGTRYAASRINNKIVYMHRLLMNPSKGKQIDHINNNGLDNRRENLRIATDSENKFNHKLIKTNKTGYHGVYWDLQMKKWGVGISLNGKHKALGYFLTKEEAALAYNDAAKKYRGEFAQLNQIGETI